MTRRIPCKSESTTGEPPCRSRSPIEVHKALADDTRYRLYRYLRLSGRPVAVRELATRLSLHPNTVRPHLRRLEEVGLVASETRRGGRRRPTADGLRGGRRRAARGSGPQAARRHPVRSAHDRPSSGTTPRSSRASGAPTWWAAPLRGRVRSDRPARTWPCCRRRSPEAGFTPRFRRTGKRTVEITLRDCPFRDLLDEHRELVCAVHRGLLEGMLGRVPPCPADDVVRAARRADHGCRLSARGAEATRTRVGLKSAPERADGTSDAGGGSASTDRWRQGGLEMETGSPIVPEFNSWLEELVNGEGSDLHVKVGSPPMIRLPHGLIRLERDPLTAIETQAIADGIVPADRKATLRRERGEWTSPTRSRTSDASERTCSGSAARSRWSCASFGSAAPRSRRWGCRTRSASSPTSTEG